MDDLPQQMFDVARSEMTLFRHALTDSDVFGLSINIDAVPKDVATEDGPYSMAPGFYTEWLDIPQIKLASRDVGCLDGYVMEYDVDREEELGFDQFPGAICQDSHAGFEAATMSLTHVGQGKYRVQAQGRTEFAWTFQIDTVAAFKQIMFRDGWADSAKQPDPRIEAEFATFFDVSHFDVGWKQQGSATYNWSDYIATPKDSTT